MLPEDVHAPTNRAVAPTDCTGPRVVRVGLQEGLGCLLADLHLLCKVLFRQNGILNSWILLLGDVGKATGNPGFPP